MGNDDIFNSKYDTHECSVTAGGGLSPLDETEAKGFYLGADYLVEIAMKKRSVENFLIFPIIFCYRHYIELALKAILHRMYQLGMIEQDFDTKHYIGSDKGNFKIFIDNCDKIYPGNKFPAEIIEIVDYISKLDPNSYRFRYATDIKGQPNFPEAEKIDLSKLRSDMKEVSTVFDGVICELDEYLKNKEELDYYYELGLYPPKKEPPKDADKSDDHLLDETELKFSKASKEAESRKGMKGDVESERDII